MTIGDEPIGVEVLGAGRMGQTHIRNLARITDQVVMVVADTEPKPATAMTLSGDVDEASGLQHRESAIDRRR